MFIDLSVLLNEQTPTYPGDPATKITTGAVVEKDGYHDHVVSVATHVGTHMDAPAHMIAGGKTLDQYPIEKFSGRGVYVQSGADITKADIQAGDIVLIHTGMSDKYHSPEYFENYPVLSEETARYLVGKMVSIVGVDMCSPDKPPFAVHKILLGGDVLIIENLTNLAQLNGKNFKVHAFPIKLELDAAPVRVVAEV